ncbi:hypothetical protein P9112_005249 [Eukaryota sp. TZLM1-RC]
MRKDMIMHIKSCPACQKTAPVSRKVIESSSSLWADRPFTRINADTIGPLHEDDNGYKYLIVFVDSFTRYTIICRIKELNAVEATNQLLWNVVAIFGIPLLIHSDNGIEFATAIFKGLCDLLNIEVSRSLSGFSRSNGLVERRHRDILQSLRKILVDSGDYSNWSEYIPINLVTGSLSTASIYHGKLYLSDFPKEDLDWHKNIAAGYMEESVIVKIIDHFDYVDSNNNKVPYCTAVWYGGETSSVPVADVKSTEAFQKNLRSISPRTTRKQKASSNSKSKTNSPAVSTRSSRSRSRREKR